MHITPRKWRFAIAPQCGQWWWLSNTRLWPRLAVQLSPSFGHSNSSFLPYDELYQNLKIVAFVIQHHPSNLVFSSPNTIYILNNACSSQFIGFKRTSWINALAFRHPLGTSNPGTESPCTQLLGMTQLWIAYLDVSAFDMLSRGWISVSWSWEKNLFGFIGTFRRILVSIHARWHTPIH